MWEKPYLCSQIRNEKKNIKSNKLQNSMKYYCCKCNAEYNSLLSLTEHIVKKCVGETSVTKEIVDLTKERLDSRRKIYEDAKDNGHQELAFRRTENYIKVAENNDTKQEYYVPEYSDNVEDAALKKTANKFKIEVKKYIPCNKLSLLDEAQNLETEIRKENILQDYSFTSELLDIEKTYIKSSTINNTPNKNINSKETNSNRFTNNITNDSQSKPNISFSGECITESLSAVKPKLCVFCKKSFLFNFQLKNHKQKNCKKIFNIKKNYTFMRKNICENCNLKFKNNISLSTHRALCLSSHKPQNNTLLSKVPKKTAQKKKDNMKINYYKMFVSTAKKKTFFKELNSNKSSNKDTVKTTGIINVNTDVPNVSSNTTHISSKSDIDSNFQTNNIGNKISKIETNVKEITKLANVASEHESSSNNILENISNEQLQTKYILASEKNAENSKITIRTFDLSGKPNLTKLQNDLTIFAKNADSKITLDCTEHVGNTQTNKILISDSTSSKKSTNDQTSQATTPPISDYFFTRLICDVCYFRFDNTAALTKHKTLYCKRFNTQKKLDCSEKSQSSFKRIAQLSDETAQIKEEITGRNDIDVKAKNKSVCVLKHICDICGNIFENKTDYLADNNVCKKILHTADLVVNKSEVNKKNLISSFSVANDNNIAIIRKGECVEMDDTITKSEETNINIKKGDNCGNNGQTNKPISKENIQNSNKTSLQIIDNDTGKKKTEPRAFTSKAWESSRGKTQMSKNVGTQQHIQPKDMDDRTCYQCGSKFDYIFALKRHQSLYCKIFNMPKQNFENTNVAKSLETGDTGNTKPVKKTNVENKNTDLIQEVQNIVETRTEMSVKNTNTEECYVNNHKITGGKNDSTNTEPSNIINNEASDKKDSMAIKINLDKPLESHNKMTSIIDKLQKEKYILQDVSAETKTTHNMPIDTGSEKLNINKIISKANKNKTDQEKNLDTTKVAVIRDNKPEENITKHSTVHENQLQKLDDSKTEADIAISSSIEAHEDKLTEKDNVQEQPTMKTSTPEVLECSKDQPQASKAAYPFRHTQLKTIDERTCYQCGSKFEYIFALQRHHSLYCKIFNVPKLNCDKSGGKKLQIEKNNDIKNIDKENGKQERSDMTESIKNEIGLKKKDNELATFSDNEINNNSTLTPTIPENKKKKIDDIIYTKKGNSIDCENENLNKTATAGENAKLLISSDNKIKTTAEDDKADENACTIDDVVMAESVIQNSKTSCKEQVLDNIHNNVTKTTQNHGSNRDNKMELEITLEITDPRIDQKTSSATESNVTMLETSQSNEMAHSKNTLQAASESVNCVKLDIAELNLTKTVVNTNENTVTEEILKKEPNEKGIEPLINNRKSPKTNKEADRNLPNKDSSKTNDLNEKKATKKPITAPKTDSADSNTCDVCGYRFEYSFALKRHKTLYCKMFKVPKPSDTGLVANSNESKLDERPPGRKDNKICFQSKKEKKLEKEEDFGKANEKECENDQNSQKQKIIFDLREKLNKKSDLREKIMCKKRISADDQPDSKDTVMERDILNDNKNANMKIEDTEYVKNKALTENSGVPDITLKISLPKLSVTRVIDEKNRVTVKHDVIDTTETENKCISSVTKPASTITKPISKKITNTSIDPKNSVKLSLGVTDKGKSCSPAIHPRAIRVYQRKEKNDQQPKIFCEKCGNIINTINSLENPPCGHKRTFFQCPVCKTNFPNINSLISHHNKIHEDSEILVKEMKSKRNRLVSLYYCCHCGEGFKFLIQLMNHKVRHHQFYRNSSNNPTPIIKPNQQEEKIYVCTFCNEKPFSSLEMLLKHEEQSEDHRKNEMKFPNIRASYAPKLGSNFEHVCYICKIGFRTFKNQQIHMLTSYEHYDLEKEISKKVQKPEFSPSKINFEPRMMINPQQHGSYSAPLLGHFPSTSYYFQNAPITPQEYPVHQGGVVHPPPHQYFAVNQIHNVYGYLLQGQDTYINQQQCYPSSQAYQPAFLANPAEHFPSSNSSSEDYYSKSIPVHIPDILPKKTLNKPSLKSKHEYSPPISIAKSELYQKIVGTLNPDLRVISNPSSIETRVYRQSLSTIDQLPTLSQKSTISTLQTTSYITSQATSKNIAETTLKTTIPANSRKIVQRGPKTTEQTASVIMETSILSATPSLKETSSSKSLTSASNPDYQVAYTVPAAPSTSSKSSLVLDPLELEKPFIRYYDIQKHAVLSYNEYEEKERKKAQGNKMGSEDELSDILDIHPEITISSDDEVQIVDVHKCFMCGESFRVQRAFDNHECSGPF